MVSSLTTCWAHFDEVQPNCSQEWGPVSRDMPPPISLRIMSKILAKGAAVILGFRKHWEFHSIREEPAGEPGLRGRQHRAEEVPAAVRTLPCWGKHGNSKQLLLLCSNVYSRTTVDCVFREEPLAKQSSLWWNSEIEISQPVQHGVCYWAPMDNSGIQCEQNGEVNLNCKETLSLHTATHLGKRLL